VTLADASHAETPSPARALQALLSRNLEEEAGRRWSPRQTLVFVLAVCGGFWAALGAALRLLLR